MFGALYGGKHSVEIMYFLINNHSIVDVQKIYEINVYGFPTDDIKLFLDNPGREL
jgi:hypothetical protein